MYSAVKLEPGFSFHYFKSVHTKFCLFSLSTSFFSPVDLLFIVFSQDLRFYMKEMLGFSDQELKAMLLATPKVYLSGMYTV